VRNRRCETYRIQYGTAAHCDDERFTTQMRLGQGLHHKIEIVPRVLNLLAARHDVYFRTIPGQVFFEIRVYVRREFRLFLRYAGVNKDSRIGTMLALAGKKIADSRITRGESGGCES